MRQLDTETLSAQDITTALTVLTHTPSTTVATRCALSVALSGLDESGGTFSLYVTIGGVPLQPYPMVVAFGENATAIIQREFLCPANAVVIAQILSPNAADTSVGIVATLWDVTPLQPVTAGRQIGVESDGDVTKVNALNGHTPQTGDVFAALPANFSDLLIEPATKWTDLVLEEYGSAMTVTSASGGFTEDMVGRYMFFNADGVVRVSVVIMYTNATTIQCKNTAYYEELMDGNLTNVIGVIGGRVWITEQLHRSPDSYGATLVARIKGTLDTGTHKPQSGDGYAVVASAVHGLAALKTLLDSLPANVEAALVNDGDATPLLQAIADKFAGDFNIEDLSLAAMAAAIRDGVLNRVLAGNHDTAGTLGLLAQKLAVGGTLANTDNADTFKAATPEIPTAAAIASAVWALAAAIDGKTPAEALRYIAAVLAGKATGAGTEAETFIGLDGATPRVRVTADAEGNRTAVEYDPEAAP